MPPTCRTALPAGTGSAGRATARRGAPVSTASIRFSAVSTAPSKTRRDAMQDLVLLEQHEAELRALLHSETGAEAAAYVIFGRAQIGADPWTGDPRTRFISHAIHAIPEEDRVSAS